LGRVAYMVVFWFESTYLSRNHMKWLLQIPPNISANLYTKS